MNFTTLAFSPINRMNEVDRYSSVYQETRESLSEHTAEVMTMSYMIALKMYELGESPDNLCLGLLLEKCLLHDIDEVITGDIPRNTKYASPGVLSELKNVAEDAVTLAVGQGFSISTKNMIMNTWRTAKEGREGLILKVVDMLCVAKKCITEIELRGNLSFLKVVTELESHLVNTLDDTEQYKIFTEAGSKFLRDLVSQAKNEITTIRVRYQHIIDKYHIKENVINNDLHS